MSKINLLPDELAPKASVVKITKALKQVEIASLIVLLLSGAILVGLFLINWIKANDLKNQESQLKISVQNLENVEQNLVFAKDRLQKIKTVWGEESSVKNVDSLNKFIQEIPQTINLTEVDISPQKTTVSLVATSSKDVSQFMAALISFSDYKSLVLKSFTFSLTNGYLITYESVLN